MTKLLLRLFVKNYENNELKSVTLNGKDVPVNLANNDIEILKDGAKEYGKNGELISEVKVNKDNTTLVAYYSPNKVKSEISFYRTTNCKRIYIRTHPGQEVPGIRQLPGGM